jgi:hypothetical protein
VKTKEDIRREEEEKGKKVLRKTNPQDSYNRQFNSQGAEYLSKNPSNIKRILIGTRR